jgi:AcrR family transcriptional regulator
LSTPKSADAASAGSGRKRRARDSLSRELIVAAAEEIAQQEGLEKLTFQAIGEKLGAHPTSLYRHFRDKDELMLVLIDTLRARSYAGAMIATDDWVADVRAQARLIHDHYMRYPEFALQMATRRPTDFGSMDFMIGALRRAGYGAEESALYARALGQLVRSATSIQAAIEAQPAEIRELDEVTWEIDFRRLDPEDYPNITWAGSLPGIRDPRAWETALELMIESIVRRAPGRDGAQPD